MCDSNIHETETSNMDVETTAQTPWSTNTGKNVFIGHFMKKILIILTNAIKQR